MNLLTHLSINRKLTLVIRLTSTVARMPAGTAFLGDELITVPSIIEPHVLILADVIGLQPLGDLQRLSFQRIELQKNDARRPFGEQVDHLGCAGAFAAGKAVGRQRQCQALLELAFAGNPDFEWLIKRHAALGTVP